MCEACSTFSRLFIKEKRHLTSEQDFRTREAENTMLILRLSWSLTVRTFRMFR